MLFPFAHRGRLGVLAAALLVALALLVLVPYGAPGARTASSLEREIAGARERESRLKTTAERLGAIERAATQAAAAAQARLDDVQREYDAAQTRLDGTTTDLRRTRERLVRLRQRLADGREALAASLRTQYTTDRPGVVEVVLQADGFNELLERLHFMKQVQAHDTRLVGAVRSAQTATNVDERRLAGLRRSQARLAQARSQQRDAASSMAAGLEQRRQTVSEAHRARLAALSNTRSRRQGAERTLARLEAARERAARQFSAPAASDRAAGASAGSSGGSGGWAIPWSIVQCESGGQNVGPNSAGASGYYQFIPSTWKAMGGSTPHAYQASKAEQDRLASRLWAGGSGARNWDCAAIVGYFR